MQIKKQAFVLLVLFGSNDHLISFESISDFAKKHNFTLTIKENGEHWFLTEEQVAFLDDWVKKMHNKNNQ